jgi:hypothetical protein
VRMKHFEAATGGRQALQCAGPGCRAQSPPRESPQTRLQALQMLTSGCLGHKAHQEHGADSAGGGGSHFGWCGRLDRSLEG